MNWTVKNVKSWTGRDGIGTECSLYRDGKKVARCLDDGNGGEMHFEWADWKAPKVDINITVSDYKAEPDANGDRPEIPHTYRGTPEEKLLAEYANTQTDSTYGKPMRKDAGWVVSELCDAYERNKRLKNKTGFVVLENGRETEYTMNTPYTPEVKARLEAKYGDKLVRILNTEFVDSREAEAARLKKQAARLKRQCQTKTLFRLKGDKPDAHWIVKAPYTPALAARIRAKHGDNLVEIINETLAAA